MLTDKIAESAEQDQNARMCRLILLYTFCKMYLRVQTTEGHRQLI